MLYRSFNKFPWLAFTMNIIYLPELIRIWPVNGQSIIMKYMERFSNTLTLSFDKVEE